MFLKLITFVYMNYYLRLHLLNNYNITHNSYHNNLKDLFSYGWKGLLLYYFERSILFKLPLNPET